jgi:REP element-mobilizing transposase RayT
MPHTYSSIFIHCVFSTKDRLPSIPPERTSALYAYLSAIAHDEGFSLISSGGTANHLHLLIALPPIVSLSHAMHKLKGSSSRWLGPDFSWQQGYGAFSVSPSQLPVVQKYIQNQEQHHRKRNFEEEFAGLLRNCGIHYDERHVFG